MIENGFAQNGASKRSAQAIRISVHENGQLLETRDCRAVALPDGAVGVFWRGLIYPVSDGDRIDIAGPASRPGDGAVERSSCPIPARFTVIEGAEESYLLIQGSVLDREQAAARLAASDVKVIRSGRYLGAPVDDLVADWFIRIECGGAEAQIATGRITALLDGVMAPVFADGSTEELRLRLVRSELAFARAREAALRSECARLKLALAERESSSVDAAADVQVEMESLRLALIEEARCRIAAEALALDGAPPPRPPPPARLKDEVAAVFESLLPRIRLLRASSDVIAVEFSDRRFLYGALAELGNGTDGMPNNWKKLKGIERWLERHIANGQDDTGRIYARLNQQDRLWDVLVSHKSEQSRDVHWLRNWA